MMEVQFRANDGTWCAMDAFMQRWILNALRDGFVKRMRYHSWWVHFDTMTQVNAETHTRRPLRLWDSDARVCAYEVAYTAAELTSHRAFFASPELSMAIACNSTLRPHRSFVFHSDAGHVYHVDASRSSQFNVASQTMRMIQCVAAPEPPEEEVDETDAPHEFLCPITLSLMRDPVIAHDGKSYDRKAIERWLFSHDTSPCFNTVLPSKDVVPDTALKESIDAWVASRMPGWIP